MRGQPFVQLLLVVSAFVALGWPVLRLTRPAVKPAVVTPSDIPGPSSETALSLTVSFVPAPEEFQLRHLGRDLLTGHGPQTEWTGTWKIALPAEGADLSLQARWPGAETPAAVHLVIRFPDDRPPVERTFWSPHGSPLTELVTVPGEKL